MRCDHAGVREEADDWASVVMKTVREAALGRPGLKRCRTLHDTARINATHASPHVLAKWHGTPINGNSNRFLTSEEVLIAILASLASRVNVLNPAS